MIERGRIVALINYVLAGMLGTLVAVSMYAERVSLSGAVEPAPALVSAGDGGLIYPVGAKANGPPVTGRYCLAGAA